MGVVKKLTIEHLKGYLGTGVELARGDVKHKLIHKLHFGKGVGSVEHMLSSDIYKLALYPLSSLTEYREDLGFVPIEWLRENVSDKLMFSDDRFIDYDDGKDKNVLHYSLFDVYSHSIGIDEILKLTQKLQEWHIDIHNLIENNLAIDKRTIKN